VRVRESDGGGVRGYRRARLAQIGEEHRHRLVDPGHQDVAGSLKLRHGLLGIESQPREVGQAGTVLEAGGERLDEDADSGCCGDAACRPQAFLTAGGPAEQQRGLRALAGQGGDPLDALAGHDARR